MKNLITKIKEKGRKIFALGGIVTMGLPFVGCESVSIDSSPSGQAAFWGFAAGAQASNLNLTPQQRATMANSSNLLYTISNQQAMKEAAEAGRSEVNVYTQQPATLQQAVQGISIQQPLTYEDQVKQDYNEFRDIVFTCNYRKDFSGDRITQADEFVGIKKRFRADEKITLIGVKHTNLNGKFIEEKNIRW